MRRLEMPKVVGFFADSDQPIVLEAARATSGAPGEPHVCGAGCSHGHAKPKSRATTPDGKPALQTSGKQNSRPWMPGH